MTGTRAGRLSAALAVLLMAGGCSGSASGPGTATPAASAPGSPAGDTGVAKVLVVMVENHSLDQMRRQMPATYALATRFGYADDYRALAHPSLPNYLAIAGGTTHGVRDDRAPAAHRVQGPSVFGQALAAGRTATVYAEGMPGTCARLDGGDRYAVRHNPWTYHVDERAACERSDVPLNRLAGDVAAGRLPTVGMVVPDTCHDAHDCDLGVADAWLADRLRAVTAGPDWRSGRLAVVVTADEDDRRAGNRVLTVVLHPALRHVVVHAPLSHLGLSRALSEVAGAAPLADAASAPSLLAAFGLHAEESPVPSRRDSVT